ncbi:MAG: hypothetical protein JOZ24_02190 [Candidatus Eremiobacteraeota bacterium]|nr:hypothetical protein [Candidatus Eremiobacteraeota bacterium]
MGRILTRTRAGLGAGLAFIIAAPAIASQTASVQVQWRVAAVGSVEVAPRSTRSDSAIGPAEDVSSRCGTVTSASDGTSALVTFARIVPDSARSSACLVPGAVDVRIATNARAWRLSQALSAAAPTGLALCGFASGTFREAAQLVVDGTSACPNGTELTTSASLVASGAAEGADETRIVEDLGLVVAPGAPDDAAALRLEFTLTYD